MKNNKRKKRSVSPPPAVLCLCRSYYFCFSTRQHPSLCHLGLFLLEP